MSDVPLTPDPARRRAPTWRELRQARELSLREVEERSGVNRGLISRIERNPDLTPERARALLDCYADPTMTPTRALTIAINAILEEDIALGYHRADPPAHLARDALRLAQRIVEHLPVAVVIR
jgi:transcriptional regulator with XRE-family HTH domain